MFGEGVFGSEKQVPQWIKEIVSDVEKMYRFRLNEVVQRYPVRDKEYYHACYWPHAKVIQLYFMPEKTDLRLYIVLHELAHAIQHIVFPFTIAPKIRTKRRVIHNEEFFQIARKLYIKYGVLDIAEKHEYKRGRKFMVPLLSLE
jgi:hypothetical protein